MPSFQWSTLFCLVIIAVCDAHPLSFTKKCQDPTVPGALCHVCSVATYDTIGCEGINQVECAAIGDEPTCSANKDCGWFTFGSKTRCEDINVQNCPGASVSLTECLDFQSGTFKTGDAACEQKRMSCERCFGGSCTPNPIPGPSPTPPTPTPPTPTPPTPTPPTPTPPSGKTCQWQTVNVKCTDDVVCAQWVDTNCDPAKDKVSSYCKSNGFCHFGASLHVEDSWQLPETASF